MASTQYKTNVELFGNCPFANDYEHTLRALSIADKLSWLRTNCVQETDLVAHNQDFKNIMLFKLDSGTNKGVLRLRCVASHAYGFNYAYIDETDKGNQWFCFITGCRYINDADVPGDGVKRGVYEFDLELDLIMTNLLSDNQLCDCMISRMHTATDGLFQHLTYENVGDYNTYEEHIINIYNPGNFKIALCVSMKWFRTNADSNMTWAGGIPQFNPILIFDYTPAGANEMTRFISHTSTEPTIAMEDIIAVYLLPAWGFTFTSDPTQQIYWKDDETGTEHYTPIIYDFAPPTLGSRNGMVGVTVPFNGLGNYTPENNKMYSGQFYKLRCEFCGGDIEDLLPQNFTTYDSSNLGYTYYFSYRCSQNWPPILTFTPRYYKGDNYAHSYALTASNLPQIATATDQYTQWSNSGQMTAAQNRRVLQGIGSAVSAVAGVAMMGTGNPLGAATLSSAGAGMLGAFTGSLSDYANANYDRTSAKIGSVDNAISLITDLMYSIEFKVIVPDEYNARRIDRFFTRYGYSMDNNVYKPSTYNRHRYTYVKTAEDCYSNSETQAWSSHVNGRANASQITQINNIFKKGITFWNNSVPRELICDYTINNPPLNI